MLYGKEQYLILKKMSTPIKIYIKYFTKYVYSAKSMGRTAGFLIGERRGQALKPADIGQGLVRAAAAQLRVGLEIQADAGALRPAEQGAQVLGRQVYAAYARGLSAGHSRDGA
jgi:hypothetical protein